MPNILIVYFNAQYPSRTAVLDHLYSFEKYADARCYYVNAAVGKLPSFIRSVPFDLIIFHTILLSTRWHRPTFEKALRTIQPLKDISGVKIAIPQDEFIHMDMVCDFINAFAIQHVFSAAKPSEWPQMYRTVDTHRVAFHQVLTGYLDESTVQRIDDLAQSAPARTMDVGYRAWKAEAWLGRHGFLKTRIAEVFLDAAPRQHVSVNISTRVNDTLYGDDWIRFLLGCRYTIGVEGGASLLDWDGSIRKRTQAYVEAHPQASFEDIETACFPGLDGQLHLRAISPRQLEACATRTCQVLIEGEYNGILQPGIHYILLKRDFSNLEDVLTLIRHDSERSRIVDNAYRDVVRSGRYSYSNFVQFVLNTALPQNPSSSSKPRSLSASEFTWQWARWRDRLSWGIVWVISRLEYFRSGLVSLLLKTSVGRALRHHRQAGAPPL